MGRVEGAMAHLLELMTLTQSFVPIPCSDQTPYAWACRGGLGLEPWASNPESLVPGGRKRRCQAASPVQQQSPAGSKLLYPSFSVLIDSHRIV
jgi:hypothetical protein